MKSIFKRISLSVFLFVVIMTTWNKKDDFILLNLKDQYSRATFDGSVIYVSPDQEKNWKRIIIKNSDKGFSVYMHYDKAIVREGQKIHAGDIIAAGEEETHNICTHLQILSF